MVQELLQLHQAGRLPGGGWSAGCAAHGRVAAGWPGGPVAPWPRGPAVAGMAGNEKRLLWGALVLIQLRSYFAMNSIIQ